MSGEGKDDRTPRGIVVSELTKHYGRNPALSGATFTVPRGVTGLLGPNGAGKTTLISVLSTAARADSGSFTIDERRIEAPDSVRWARARIGVLPQSFGYYPNYTVEEFIGYVAWLKQVPSSARCRSADAVIAQTGLTPLRNARLKTLSGGMIRRLGIAQALVNNPVAVFLDEPSAGLDLEQKTMFRDLIRGIGQNAAVLLSTHGADDVETMCDRVVVLAGGTIRFEGELGRFLEIGAKTRTAASGSPVEASYLAVLERGSGE